MMYTVSGPTTGGPPQVVSEHHSPGLTRRNIRKNGGADPNTDTVVVEIQVERVHLGCENVRRGDQGVREETIRVESK